MQILNDLSALVQALPQRAATDWVDLPAALHRQRSSAAQTDPGAILLQPGARCLVRPGTDAPRMGDVPWLPVAVLRQMDWSQPLPQLLQAELGQAPGRDWAAIGPVQVVFPGVMDIVAMADPQDAATLRAGIADLVAFGDDLGNGNLWCFSRTDGAVWYLDHDSAPLLTRVLDDVGDDLDALALMALCTAQATAQGRDDGDAQAEAWLSARWGPAMVRKWMY